MIIDDNLFVFSCLIRMESNLLKKTACSSWKRQQKQRKTSTSFSMRLVRSENTSNSQRLSAMQVLDEVYNSWLPLVLHYSEEIGESKSIKTGRDYHKQRAEG